MILIHKDNEVRKVTKGAFESFFKPLGYKIIIDTKVKEVKKDIPKKEEIIEEPKKEVSQKELKSEKANVEKKNKKED